VVFELDAFLADCAAALNDSQPALAVKEIVERAICAPHELDDALGVPASWGMKTLHCSPAFTVLQFVWPPGVVLFPHDHRMWAANGIYGGCEDNTFYRRRGDGLEPRGGHRLEAGDVAVLGADAIHAVANPSRAYTAAVHVYGGDYFATPRSQWDPVTLQESAFDVAAVRQVLAEADARFHADD
jgi:predicted metal-dependent enzyme (double-stranded beta helix superfamily)